MRSSIAILALLMLGGCVADGQIPRITSLARDGYSLRGHMWTAKGAEPTEAILVHGMHQGELYHTNATALAEHLQQTGSRIVARGSVSGGDFTIPLQSVPMEPGDLALGFVYENATISFAPTFEHTAEIVRGEKTYFVWQDEWPGFLLPALFGLTLMLPLFAKMLRGRSAQRKTPMQHNIS